MPVDTHAATDRLMRFLAIEGVTGKEAAIGRELRAALAESGVPDEAIVDEGKSINTIGNIRNVRALVGGGRVALVTSGYHMPRAMQLAALAKLDAAAFPTDFRSLRSIRPTWENWIFSLDALDMSITALREIIAMKLDIRARALGE